MNISHKACKVIVLALFSLLLTACVTEQVSGPFKKPTKEDLEKAAKIYVELAYQHIQKKNYEQAMYNVQKALAINPDSANATVALAQTYQAQGDTDKARDTFKKAIRKDDKFSPAHLSYGEFLFDQKEYKDACEQFDIAASDDFYENRAGAYANLGVCRSAQNDLVGAEAALMRSVALNEKQGSVLLDLSELKFNQKQYPEAKEYFDKQSKLVREAGQVLSPRALWLGIRLERVFGNQDAEASMAIFLKNSYPYSKETLEYQQSLKK